MKGRVDESLHICVLIENCGTRCHFAMYVIYVYLNLRHVRIF